MAAVITMAAASIYTKAMAVEFVQSAEDSSTGSLYIYDYIEADSPGGFFSEPKKSETSGKAIRDKLAALGDITQLDVHIASGGGSVMEGLAIYSQLKALKAHKTCYIDGIAASIASVIAMACDEIIMYKTSQLMIHNAAVQLGGVFNAEELRKEADSIDSVNRSAIEAYDDKTGDKCDRKKIVQMMAKETWLIASEALELGFCDSIAEGHQPSDAPEGYNQSIAGAVQSAAFSENARLRAEVRELKKSIEEMKNGTKKAEQLNNDHAPQNAVKDKKIYMRALVKALGKAE